MLRPARDLPSVLLSEKSFLAFAVAFVAYNVVGMALLGLARGCDFWEHLACIYSFARDPLHPPNPYILSSDPTHHFTPYHLLWGLVAKILHVHPFRILPVIAGANMLLFVSSVRTFAGRVIGDRRYALPLALTLLLFWYEPWDWSPFYHLGMLPLASVYPFWFALPLAIFVLAVYGDSRRPLPVAACGLAVACVFLVHPLTGSFLIVSIGAKVLTTRPMDATQRGVLLAVPCLVTALAAWSWPYFPVFSCLLGSASSAASGFAGSWHVLRPGTVSLVLSALLGGGLLAHQMVRRQFAFVPVGLAFVAAIYLINCAKLHNTKLSLYIVFVAFYCHVGIVQILRRLEDRPFHRKALAVFLVAMLAFAIPQVRTSIGRVGFLRDLWMGTAVGTHSTARDFRDLSALGGYIGTRDVVLAPMETSWELPGVLGCRVVGVFHSNPFMTDYYERKRATKLFFASSSPDEKVAILSRYSVSYVLVPMGEAKTVASFASHMTLVHRDDEYALYAIPSPHSVQTAVGVADFGGVTEVLGQDTIAESGQPGLTLSRPMLGK